MAKTSGKFKFRKHANIGYPAAEEDRHYLETCFVDTGDLDVLRDCDRAEKIVVGRTGSGKTALLQRLQETEEHVIEVNPYSLSIDHISNSTILRFFSELGVHLELFFKLLWRQVFIVEVIREYNALHTQAAQDNFLASIWQRIGKSKERKRLEALLESAGTFWKDTDERVKEITTRTESTLKAAAQAAIPQGLSFEISAAKSLSEEQKREIQTRGQEVISKIKIRELNEMFDLLQGDILVNSQRTYYIIIDRLDEAWVEDALRYQLIRCMIETIRDFHRIRNLKIIACVRTDLIERVYRNTRGAGYQREKVKSLFLNLRWTRQQLIALLDSRINQLARDSYTTASIGIADVLPRVEKGKRSPIDYILERTMYRPRDVIAFINACIKQAIDTPRITKKMLLTAEGEYSTGRLTALVDEWQGEYPTLGDAASILRKRPKRFTLSDITISLLDDFCVSFLTANGNHTSDPLVTHANDYFNGTVDAPTLRQYLAFAFYRIGLIGIKMDSTTTMHFADVDDLAVSQSEIHDDCKCAIHPMFWRALGNSE